MSVIEKPLLFDAHAHLVADDQVRYPRKPMVRPASAPHRAPGVIGLPGGKHGPNPIHEIPDASRMLRWMTEENVDGIVAVQKRMIYRYDNSYILDASDAYPELFSAVVILDAEDPGTPALVQRFIKNHGLAGVRLFGSREADGSMPWLNSAQALKTWDVAQDAGLVMDIEVLAHGGGGPSVPTIIDLARQYPKVRVVLDHLLEPELADDPKPKGQYTNYGLDERYLPLASEPNIFFKFTSINLDIYREAEVDVADVLRRAVNLFGADHIMWGSDIGTSSGTYKDMVQRMLDAAIHLTPQERQAVLHDTGKHVFVKGGVRAG